MYKVFRLPIYLFLFFSLQSFLASFFISLSPYLISTISSLQFRFLFLTCSSFFFPPRPLRLLLLLLLYLEKKYTWRYITQKLYLFRVDMADNITDTYLHNTQSCTSDILWRLVNLFLELCTNQIIYYLGRYRAWLKDNKEEEQQEQ